MKISEACYEQLNNLIKKSFDCNAQADNFAYNIDYTRYPNIANLYHHAFAHKFPQLADVISDLMIQLNARPVRKAVNEYKSEYLSLYDLFVDNDRMMEEYRQEVRKTIDIADLNDDYEVRIAMEDFLLKLLPYVKQSDIWRTKSEQYKDVLLPGYTHLQVAMPSSFGLWFGAYAESLTDDLRLMLAAWDITNQNPLGSAAGYGSSAPLDRTMTTRLLGFADLDYNVVYAQMGRGKTERAISFAYAAVAETVGRLAVDCCLYASQNFGFIHLPDSMTTGSSIMPHKKNPDVFELVRAHCNKIQGAPNDIRLITGNLPSGYFRDMQILKEVFIPIFQEMDDCLDIASYAVEKMEIVKDIMSDPKYQPAFSVEEVNRLVEEENVPFRDAYKRVGLEIMAGNFSFHGELHHTHEGSIGNLCNDKIAYKLQEVISRFGFENVQKAENSLLKGAK